MLRPTAALTLALVAVTTAGCPWGTCGDTTFTDRHLTGTFDLLEDGSVDAGLEAVDPATQEGCEALCRASTVVEVASVDACEVTDVTPTAEEDAQALVQVDCTASGQDICIGGRHHADLGERPAGCGRTCTGAWLAREAHGEAGSVIAFVRLAAELRRHGAPKDLIVRALRAAQDEVRHAREVGQLAQTRGGAVREVRAGAPVPRTLLALAVENAVEGCVAETWSAAVAGWQALHAVDPEVRATAARIAPEEAAHADLAWDLHTWLMGQLDPVQAAAVERARLQAWARLIAGVPIAPQEVRDALGLPDAAQADALARALATAVGAVAA